MSYILPILNYTYILLFLKKQNKTEKNKHHKLQQGSLSGWKYIVLKLFLKYVIIML